MNLITLLRIIEIERLYKKMNALIMKNLTYWFMIIKILFNLDLCYFLSLISFLLF